MNISIEVGGPLAEAINRLADALVSAKQADTVIEKASNKARAKKEPAPAEPVVESAPAAEPATPETAAPVKEEPLTAEGLRAKLAPLVKDGKSADIKRVLEEHGASSVSALRPEHFASVLDKLSKL